MVFKEIDSQLFRFCQIIEEVCEKNLKATLLFVDFSKAFDSIYKRVDRAITIGTWLSLSSPSDPGRNVFSSEKNQIKFGWKERLSSKALQHILSSCP